MFIVNWIKGKWMDFKIWRAYKKKIKNLRKQDPFIYR